MISKAWKAIVGEIIDLNHGGLMTQFNSMGGVVGKSTVSRHQELMAIFSENTDS